MFSVTLTTQQMVLNALHASVSAIIAFVVCFAVSLEVVLWTVSSTNKFWDFGLLCITLVSCVALRQVVL